MANPNLLFIYTDEQAFNTLAAYGNQKIWMPNLDRFAAKATVFEEAYVTQPVCTPSRSSLLTGLYPHSNGCTENNLPLPEDIPCLPEMVAGDSYRTAHFGKWHLGDELFPQHGFSEWRSIEDQYNRWFRPGRDRNRRSDYHHFLLAHGYKPKEGEYFTRSEVTRLPEEHSKPAFLAQEASVFLRQSRNAPFILYVNFLEPHMPFSGPRNGQYHPDDVELPANFNAIPGPEQPLKVRLLYEHYRRHGISGISLADEAGWRRLIANYWGLCSQVDRAIGEILTTLEETGLEENTIVVFTSDHGDMMGAHHLVAKCVMYQEAVRVPLMIRLPKQQRQRRIRGRVSQIDLVPTLLEIMGQPLPSRLQGESFADLLQGSGDAEIERPVVIEWNGPNNGLGDVSGRVREAPWMREFAPYEEIIQAFTDPVRTVITPDHWKFNCSPRGEHELYNLAADPGECHNLFDSHRDIARELLQFLRQWQRQTGDRVKLPDF
ncbi:MAG: DUF229 domain-containing protein [Lentisphaerae bacterium]|nr:MAG: DUF229 domain-containing protein [Lentisphaerota bacterium]